jgi:hypothetical protein
MSVRIQVKREGGPTKEDLDKLKKYTKMAENDDFLSAYSNDPNALFAPPSGPYEKEMPNVLDPKVLLSIPDHLRKTLMAVANLDRATADEVAGQTKRARAVESGYMNQLVLMGYLKKEGRISGGKVHFYVEKR